MPDGLPAVGSCHAMHNSKNHSFGDALTLIEGYVATVTCGTNPHVRAQNRYLPPPRSGVATQPTR